MTVTVHVPESESTRSTPAPGATPAPRGGARRVVVIDNREYPAIRLEDINRSQMARDCQCNLTHISRIFNGERRPTVNQLYQMKLSLTKTYSRQVTMDEIFEMLCEVNPAMYLKKTHQKGSSQRSGNSEL